MKLFYKVFSYFTHPLFITTLLASIFFIFSSTSEGLAITNNAYRSIMVNTLVFPLLTVLLLKGLGWVDSIYLKTQRERIIPTISSMTFYFWAYFVARHAPFDYALQVLLLSGFINLILIVLVGILMKPSLHVSSWTIASLWLWHQYSLGSEVYLGIFLASIVVLVLVIISRYRLGAHTASELLAGLGSGAVSMILASLLV